jgi:hypothetical protein
LTKSWDAFVEYAGDFPEFGGPRNVLHFGTALTYAGIFFGYAVLNLLSGILYLFMSARVEVAKPARRQVLQSVSPQIKGIVLKLATLFSLDSLGGGFLTDALVAYWFFRRFGVPDQSLAILFFAIHLLNAGSHLGAAWLAKQFGLLNTMVFTHLPSSVLLDRRGTRALLPSCDSVLLAA